jgi:hypothetical protein
MDVSTATLLRESTVIISFIRNSLVFFLLERIDILPVTDASLTLGGRCPKCFVNDGPQIASLGFDGAGDRLETERPEADLAGRHLIPGLDPHPALVNDD